MTRASVQPEWSEGGVLPYGFSFSGGSGVYVAKFAEKDTQPVYSVQDYSKFRFSNEIEAAGKRAPVFAVYAIYHRGEARKVSEFIPENLLDFRSWLSPDGRWAIMPLLATGQVLPEAWNAYAGFSIPFNRRPLTLIDVERGTSRPLLDAPIGYATSTIRSFGPLASAAGNLRLDVLWSSDSRHAVLVNTALPLDDRAEERRSMSYIVDYDVLHSTWTVLEPLSSDVPRQQVRQVGWLKVGEEFLVTHQDTDGDPYAHREPTLLKGTIYSLRNGEWIGRSVSPSVQLPDPLATEKASAGRSPSILLVESANEPPMVVASDGRRQLPLLPVDAALQAVRRAQATVVKWSEGGAHEESGLLMMPERAHSEAGLPPLVIQHYEFLPHLFRPDGHAPAGYAAQALVAQGFAVLQYAIPGELGDYTADLIGQDPTREGSLTTLRIDAAVEALASSGLIDRQRVGLVGFSRSGAMTFYAITHPGRIRIGAAVSGDGWGLGQTFRSQLLQLARLSNQDSSAMQLADIGEIDNMYRSYGGGFWRNKSNWLQQDPVFNVDRAQTPMLYAQNGWEPGGLSVVPYDLIGAFWYNRRPLELFVFPQGTHWLVDAKERAASMTATVDWMKFWLMGAEDSDQAKREMYVHWRKLKEAWTQVQSSESKSADEPTRE